MFRGSWLFDFFRALTFAGGRGVDACVFGRRLRAFWLLFGRFLSCSDAVVGVDRLLVGLFVVVPDGFGVDKTLFCGCTPNNCCHKRINKLGVWFNDEA